MLRIIIFNYSSIIININSKNILINLLFLYLLQNFHDFTFGTVRLTDIHLSQRFTTDSNGYYKSSFVIKI
jgi:hypothetical protein